MRSSGFGLFGKLPFRDDFVRMSASGEPFASFDDWLVTSVEWANVRAGQAWRAAFSSGAVQAFVFRTPTAASRDSLLVGATVPSADRAGRQFPLAVGRPFVPTVDLLAAPELLPVVLEEDWHAATGLIGLDREILESELEHRLAKLDGHAAPAFEARATYEAWLAELPVPELWTMLYGPGYGEQPGYALRTLVEAIRPYRGIETPNTPLSLRLPLGRAAGAAVCFWIDLTRRIARWKETIPSFFWTHDGSAGAMLLHLGAPPPSTCAELWLPSRARDEVCDLCAVMDGSQVASLPPLPAMLASSISSSRHHLKELLDHASAI